MAYNVNDLATYVAENKETLVRDILFGGKKGDTIAKLTKQLGVKTTDRLHVLDYAATLQNGKGCGFQAEGDTDFAERDIETAIFKVNDEWCPDDLLNKYAEYLVRFGADKNAEAMPFEAEIMDALVAEINKQMETLVWQGQKAKDDLIDGFIALANAEDDTVVPEIAEGATAYDAIKTVIMAIPEEIIDEATVFVAPAIYREFVQDLVEKNLYHYESGKIENDDLMFPGTNIAVHKTIGLTGSAYIYASTYKNMFYATDAMNDKEEVRAWFSDDADLFRVKVKWNAGVQTLFPNLVVMGKKA